MLVSRVALTPHLYTAAWIPAMLCAIELCLREDKLRPGRGAGLVGVLFGLQILAGAPQISYYTALLLPIYWVARACMTGPGERKSRVGRALVHGASAALVAALLAGIQLAPTLEFAGQTERGEIDLQKLSGQGLNGGFLWRALVGFTGPEIEDTDSINAIGAGAILLALLALAGKKRRSTAALLWLLGFAAWLLSIGPLSGLWAKVLPGYTLFHAPRRALILWSVVGSLLAAVGAHHLLLCWRAKKWPRVGYYIALIVLSAGTWWMLPRLERVFCTTERFQPPADVAALLNDARYVAIDPTLNYSYDSRRPDFGESLMPDLASWHDLYQAGGYDPLVLERYALARDLACRGSGVFYPSHGVFFTDPGSPVLRLFAVQYFVGRYDLMDPGRLIPGAGIDQQAIAAMATRVGGSDAWPVYRFNEDRPRAWTVERVVEMRTAREALAAAAANNAYRVAFTEGGLGLRTASPPIVSEFERLNGRTMRIELERPASEETMLVVAEAYADGWVARFGDGTREPVVPVNGAAMGVLVPPGEQDVVLKYAPRSFTRGLLLSFAGLVLAAALFAGRRKGMGS